MAPSISLIPAKGNLLPGPKAFNQEVELNGNELYKAARYPNYLPTWNPNQKYPPLEPFEHIERGLGADTSFKDLLSTRGKSLATITHLTPTIGSEIAGGPDGVQLSKLTDAAKDQLALLVAQRKVVVFRDQDFADLPIQQALDFGAYFGRHHIHPTNGSPEGFPEIQIAHRGAGDESYDGFFAGRTSSVAWHSDVTYEEQPPGTTFLYVLDGPTAGGDTLFVNQVEAYNRLSPAFQRRLHGLKAIHSGMAQAEYNRRKGGVLRREPVENVHPLVRTHPATGEKALFVNKQFTRHILGFKQEESDYLLNFLYNHMAFSADFQVRVQWKEGTVVVWDNRVTAHTAILDWASKERRHLARITPQAERPYETPFESD